MENRHIAFSPPDITEEEITEVVDTLKSGWITTGPKTKKFEQKLAEAILRAKSCQSVKEEVIQRLSWEGVCKRLIKLWNK